MGVAVVAISPFLLLPCFSTVLTSYCEAVGHAHVASCHQKPSTACHNIPRYSLYFPFKICQVVRSRLCPPASRATRNGIFQLLPILINRLSLLSRYLPLKEKTLNAEEGGRLSDGAGEAPPTDHGPKSESSKRQKTKKREKLIEN